MIRSNDFLMPIQLCPVVSGFTGMSDMPDMADVCPMYPIYMEALIVRYIAKNAIIVVVLLQLCCNNGQQQNETSVDSTDHALSFGKITVAKRELSATLEKELTQRLKLGEITIAEIITQELRSAASIYEMSYNQAILSCGGCSELELLLIWQRVMPPPQPFSIGAGWPLREPSRRAPYRLGA